MNQRTDPSGSADASSGDEEDYSEEGDSSGEDNDGYLASVREWRERQRWASSAGRLWRIAEAEAGLKCR